MKKHLSRIILAALISLSLCNVRSQTVLKKFQDDATHKYGYQDKAGKIIIPARYEDAASFRENLA
ncbi:MAG TPA: WG repeat-containing protein, partial [Chitinophagaceae bacterium]|nr:WG repeat-containing protein [Chitinophagaceae bacterium]